MNTIVATSRGKVVREFFEKNKGGICGEFYFYPGAKYARLATEANKIVSCHSQNSKPLTIYFMGGLPDITVMKRDKRDNYEEVIMEGNCKNIIQNIMSEITHIHHNLSQSNTKSVFCPIIPSNIEKWNSKRLAQGKTRRLKFSNNYINMQKELHTTIIDLNREIIAFNKHNSLATPFITIKTIISLPPNPKKSTPRYKFSFVNFPDGVHFNVFLAKIVANQLIKAINRNSPAFTQKPHILPTPILLPPTIPTIKYESEDEDERVNHSRHWRP